MTSAPITDVKSTLMGNISNTTKGLEVQNAESFAKVFDKNQTPARKKTDDTVKKVEDVESIQNHANIQKNKTSENLKEQTEEVKEVVDVEEMEKVAEETANMMVEKVAETFNVSVEEVEAVLKVVYEKSELYELFPDFYENYIYYPAELFPDGIHPNVDRSFKNEMIRSMEANMDEVWDLRLE